MLKAESLFLKNILRQNIEQLLVHQTRLKEYKENSKMSFYKITGATCQRVDYKSLIRKKLKLKIMCLHSY